MEGSIDTARLTASVRLADSAASAVSRAIDFSLISGADRNTQLDRKRGELPRRSLHGDYGVVDLAAVRVFPAR